MPHVKVSSPIMKITFSGNPASSRKKRIGVTKMAINTGILARLSARRNIDV